MKETGTYSITRARGRAGKVMLIPSLLILGIFVVYPIIRSLFLSLYDWNLLTGVSSFNGLGNFVKAAGDERFWNALKNILYFSSLYVPGTLLIALGLAWLLYRGIPGKNLFRSIFFLPAISAMSIVALCWRFLLDGDIGLFPTGAECWVFW
jgi:ABC-type sugar transport system permease subunit